MISKLPWKILTYYCPKKKENIQVTTKILNPRYTLVNGQAFNWHVLEENKEDQKDEPIFHGVLRNYYIQMTTDKDDFVIYRAVPDDKELQSLFYDYFQFDMMITNLSLIGKNAINIFQTS